MDGNTPPSSSILSSASASAPTAAAIPPRMTVPPPANSSINININISNSNTTNSNNSNNNNNSNSNGSSATNNIGGVGNTSLSGSGTNASSGMGLLTSQQQTQQQQQLHPPPPLTTAKSSSSLPSNRTMTNLPVFSPSPSPSSTGSNAAFGAFYAGGVGGNNAGGLMVNGNVSNANLSVGSIGGGSTGSSTMVGTNGSSNSVAGGTSLHPASQFVLQTMFSRFIHAAETKLTSLVYFSFARPGVGSGVGGVGTALGGVGASGNNAVNASGSQMSGGGGAGVGSAGMSGGVGAPGGGGVSSSIGMSGMMMGGAAMMNAGIGIGNAAAGLVGMGPGMGSGGAGGLGVGPNSAGGVGVSGNAGAVGSGAGQGGAGSMMGGVGAPVTVGSLAAVLGITDVNAVRAGADAEFDGLLKGLGSVARHSPKLLIDSVMVWRKSKSERSSADDVPSSAPAIFRKKEMENFIKERKSLVSNFILCRALIEIVGRLNKDTLSEELGAKLEDMVFGQLRNTDPELTFRSPNRYANMDFFSQFVGTLSVIRFANVNEASDPSSNSAVRDLKVELLIRCMRYLSLKIYPQDALDETATFLQIFAEKFHDSHNARIKHAYAELFIELLEPIAAVATAEVNVQGWMEAIEKIYAKASRMVQKKGHIQVAMPLVVTVLCVSRKEFFLKNWLPLIEICLQRFRDKSMRTMALISVTRLLWVYLYRSSDPSSATATKRIETLLRLLFPPRSRAILPEGTLLDHFVRLMYIILVKWTDVVLDQFLFILLGIEPLTNTNTVSSSGASSQTSSTSGQTINSLQGSTVVASLTFGSYQSDGSSPALSDDMTSRTGVSMPPMSPAPSMTSSSSSTAAPLSPVPSNTQINETIQNPERLIIALRSFLLLLADMENSLTGNMSASGLGSDLGGNAGNAFSFPGFGLGAGNATTQSNIVVQGKLKLQPPPFPTLVMPRFGDLEALTAMRDRSQISSAISNNPPTGSSSSNPFAGGFASAPSTSTTIESVRVRGINTALLNSVQQRMSEGMRTGLERINALLGRVATALDKACGSHLLLSSSSSSSFSSREGGSGGRDGLLTSASSISVTSSARRPSMSESAVQQALGSDLKGDKAMAGALDGSTSLNRQIMYDLMRNYIDCIPRYIPSRIPPTRLIEMLAKYSFHVDEGVRSASISALLRIASIRQGENDVVDGKVFWTLGGSWRPGRTLAEATAKVVGDAIIALFGEKNLDSSISSDLVDIDVKSSGMWVYFQLLDRWLNEVKDGISGGNANLNVRRFLDPDIMERILSDIEGRGLFYLCAISPSLRRVGLRLLRLAEDFERSVSPSAPRRSQDEREKAGKNTRSDLKFSEYGTTIKGLSSLPLRTRASRIIHILEEASYELVGRHYIEPPAMLGAATARYEQQKLQQQHQQNLLKLLATKESLIMIASSDVPSDIAIWSRCFPDFAQYCYEYATMRALKNSLSETTLRLASANSAVLQAADSAPAKTSTSTGKWPSAGGVGSTISSSSSGAASTGSNLMPLSQAMENLLAQWKRHLIFACACIEVNTDYGEAVEVDADGMKSSGRPLMSPRILFGMVMPLLASERNTIRKATVTSMGVVHWLSYRTLLDVLQPYMISVMEDTKARLSQRKLVSSVMLTATSRRLERLRVEICHLLSLTANFVDYDVYRRNEGMMKSVISFIRDTFRFLSDAEVRLEWDYQMLRYYFCSLVDKFYDRLVLAVTNEQKTFSIIGTLNIRSIHENVEAFFPFELRLSLFKLLEQWCGQGKQAVAFLDKQTKTMLAALDPVKDNRERGAIATNMNEQRRALQIAALKAMASLCKGPIDEPQDDVPFTGTFNLDEILFWISDMFTSPDETVHAFAMSAIEGLLIHNPDSDFLMEECIRECYRRDPSSAGAVGFFNAIVNLYAGKNDEPVGPGGFGGADAKYPCVAHRMIALALYKAGDNELSVRKSAVKLLRAVEMRLFRADIDSPVAVDEDDEDPEGADSSGHVISVDEENEMYESSAISSTLPIMFKYAQAIASSRLANERPLFTCQIISELCMRLDQVATIKPFNRDGLRDILVFMVPWIRNLRLLYSDDDSHKLLPTITGGTNDGHVPANIFLQSGGPSSATLARTEAMLSNLLYITMRFGDEFVTEVENLWAQLTEAKVPTEGDQDPQELTVDDVLEGLRNSSTAGTEVDEHETRMQQHVETIVDYLIAVGLKRRNPKFVTPAKRVIVYLSRTQACGYLLDALIRRITPRSLVPVDASKSTRPLDNAFDEAHKLALADIYVPDLSGVLPEMPMRPAFGIGGLACILLVDLAIEIGASALMKHLPLLLHVIFMQMDHFISLVCDQMRVFLMNLIHSTLPRRVGGSKSEEVYAKLALKEGRRLWPYEDISPYNREIGSCKQLADLISGVLDIFARIDPDIREKWSSTALVFAVSCPVRHAACRSLQILRNLKPTLNQRVLGEILLRLSSTVADSTEEIQGFALEILITLDLMVTLMQATNDTFKIYPQFFWGSVAIIHSPYEWEFWEGVKTLGKILKKLDLQDPNVRNVILINLPTKWRGTFNGLQPMLLRGLESATTERDCLDVLNDLLEVENDTLVDKNPSRLIVSVLANMPRLLQGFAANPLSDDAEKVGLTVETCLEVAGKLATLAKRSSKPALERLLTSYSKQRFRTREDFLQQFTYILRDYFFPTHEVVALQFITSMLSNKLKFYQKWVLKILKLLLPLRSIPAPENSALRTRSNDVSGVNIEEELVPTLMDLLGTEVGDIAAEVLDELLTGRITLSESNLRVVFGGKSIYKLVRESHAKNNELSQNIPSGVNDLVGKSTTISGWKVRDLAKASKITRYNVAGVASTCATSAHDSTESKSRSRLQQLSNVSGGGTISPNNSSPLRNFVSVEVQFSPNRSDSSTQRSRASIPPAANPVDFELLLQEFEEMEAIFESQEPDRDSITVQPPEEEPLQPLGGAENEQTPMHNQTLSASGANEETGGPLERERRNSIASNSSEVSYFAESFDDPNISRDSSVSSLLIEGLSEDLSNVNSDDEEDIDNLNVEVSYPSVSFAEREDPQVSSSGAKPVIEEPSGETAESEPALILPSHLGLSATKRLLSHSTTKVLVSFRLSSPFELTQQEDSKFVPWLIADLAGCLSIERSCVNVESVMGGGSEAGPGTFVTISIKGPGIFGEGNEGIESAAFAEDLIAIMAGIGENELLKERVLLLHGAVTSKLDVSYPPEIVIDFMGMLVPYIPEGFRYQLPHRKQLVRLQTAPPSVLNSPMLLANGDRTELSSTKSRTKKLSERAATDALRIFPAAFELVLQLYDDWIAAVRDLISKTETRILQETLRVALDQMLSLRGKHEGYCPFLLLLSHEAGDLDDNKAGGIITASIDELSLLKAATLLTAMGEGEYEKQASFLEKREQQKKNVDNQISLYLAARQNTFGGEHQTESDDAEPTNRSEGARIVEILDLGASLMTLYGMILALEGLLEDLLEGYE
ncbi:Cell morphogenesis protein PAG1, partial [Blyttiomyces sp. JEL0837]